MRAIFPLIAVLSALLFCTCERKINCPENPAGSVTGERNEPDSIVETLYSGPDCSACRFSNPRQQADSLKKFFEQLSTVEPGRRTNVEERFFCAFPNSFREMHDLFGYGQDGPCPLAFDGHKMIKYFVNLRSVPRETLYEKYINICVDGVWEADNISNAFYFERVLSTDTKTACQLLAKRSDPDVKSVFLFIFDGPHPNHIINKAIYKDLLPKIRKENRKMAALLTAAYTEMINRNDRHNS